MRLVPAGGSPPQTTSESLVVAAGPQPERDTNRLLTIECREHGEDCLSIECRIVQNTRRIYPSIVNLRHDMLINRALGTNDPELPHIILEAGRLGLEDGDAELYLLAMLHLEDLGYAYWTGTDWSLHLPERTP